MIHDAYSETSFIVNPDYNPEQAYVSRRNERKEWEQSGHMVKLVVVDDGTCQAWKAIVARF